MTSGKRTFGRFENALRLMLELHDLCETGRGDSEEANQVRDKMDGPWGWHGGPHDGDLTEPEQALLAQVLGAL